MEYKRIYIKFDEISERLGDNESDYEAFEFFPQEGEKSEKADEQIKELIEQGYEIASTTPILATYMEEVTTKDGVKYPFTAVYTDGIEVFLIKNNAN